MLCVSCDPTIWANSLDAIQYARSSYYYNIIYCSLWVHYVHNLKIPYPDFYGQKSVVYEKHAKNPVGKEFQDLCAHVFMWLGILV